MKSETPTHQNGVLLTHLTDRPILGQLDTDVWYLMSIKTGVLLNSWLQFSNLFFFKKEGPDPVSLLERF